MTWRSSCIAVGVLAMSTAGVDDGWAATHEGELVNIQAESRELRDARRAREGQLDEIRTALRLARQEWSHCVARRLGTRRMEDYLDRVEALRVSVEAYRQSIERRRQQLESRRLELERKRAGLNPADHDSVYELYLVPMNTYFSDFRELLGRYDDYLGAMSEYTGFFNGAAERCSTRRGLLRAIQEGTDLFAKVVDALPEVPDEISIVSVKGEDS